MRKYLLIFSIFLIQLSVFAQDSLVANTSNPRATVRTHLYFLQDNHYYPELAALAFKQTGIDIKTAKESAIKLKQIWDGSGTFINLDDLSENSNHKDSTYQKSKAVVNEKFPEIYVENINGKWVYSVESIVLIEELHSEVFPFGTAALLDFLPKMGTRKIMGLYLYQYLGILLLALISVVVHKVLTFIFDRLITRLIVQAGYAKLADRFLLPVARPISIFVVILLLRLFLPVLQLPLGASHWAMLVIRAALPLFGTIVFYRLVDILAMYLERLALKTESTLDDQLVPLLRKTLKTFVVGIGTLFILQNLDIPIIPLLTGLSIGGLAFALAAQDTIKNFFGSLMIFIDRPFQIGDWITSGDIDGSVEEVGFRSSRIRTFRNSLMYVPNGKLADSTIDNHGMREYRRFYTQIAITYDTPPEMIETFVQGLRTIVERHPDTRKDAYNIYFNDMASFSLNIMFYIFFKVPDWPAELKARHEILLEVIKLGKALGVNFAFPTQTLHMENFPGQASLSSEYLQQADLDAKILAHFKSSN